MAELVLLSGLSVGRAGSHDNARAATAAALGLEETEVQPTALLEAEYLIPNAVITVLVRRDPDEERLRVLLEKDEDGSAHLDEQALRLTGPGASICRLPSTLCREFSHLRELSLVYLPRLSELSASVSGLLHLVELHVEGTAVRLLPPLEKLEALRALRAPNNLLQRLSHLPKGLKEVDITGNAVSGILDLSQLPDLVAFRAARNQIRGIKFAKNHAALEELDLLQNGVHRVAPSGKAPLLRQLSLSGAWESAALAMLNNCGRLRTLMLVDCNLYFLDREVCRRLGEQLESIDLSQNKLQKLPQELCGQKLQQLRVCFNRLGSLPAALGQSENLEVLDVSRNLWLKTLPKGLKKLPRLRVLIVTGCYLEKLSLRSVKTVVVG